MTNGCAPLLMLLVVASTAQADHPTRRRQKPLPPPARVVIDAVVAAARARDFAALRQTMAPQFIDEGGDEGPVDAALETWHRDPALLDLLVSLLKDCRFETRF